MRRVDPVKHAEKRREIMAAAERCFVRAGFRGATIADICAEAGISPGHLYHYFASKEAIVGAIIAAGLEDVSVRFGRMMENPDAIAALAAEFERAKVRYGRERQVLLLDILAEAGRNPAMFAVLQEHSREAHLRLAGFLRKGQERGQIDPGLDPDLAARVLIGVIDGSKTLTIRDPGFDMKKGLELLKTLIIRFLTPPAGAAGR